MMTITGAGDQETAKAEMAFKNIIFEAASSYYDHRFVQLRTDGLARSCIYTNDSETTPAAFYAPTNLRIDPDTLMTLDCTSTIMGFSLKDSVKVAFAEYYSRVPFVIPSEKIFIQSFSTGPTPSGLNCNMNIPLINAKEIVALFPRNANELTVFRNPECHHLMLTLLNRNFPQKGAHTNSTEFYRLELESCNLDTILRPTESFENSYLKKVCPTTPIRQRCNEDDTDFALVFNLERQSSNSFFSDPVNSANESISLTGAPQAQGFGGDVYYYLSKEAEPDDDAHHKTCRILAVVSDSFWLFATGQRATYETSLCWNETLQKNFPDLIRTLTSRQTD
jgi:hypothetical protein